MPDSLIKSEEEKEIRIKHDKINNYLNEGFHTFGKDNKSLVQELLNLKEKSNEKRSI